MGCQPHSWQGPHRPVPPGVQGSGPTSPHHPLPLAPKSPSTPRPPPCARFGRHHCLSPSHSARGRSHTSPLLPSPAAAGSCLSLISREGPGPLAWPRRGCISFRRANEPQLPGSRSVGNGDPPQGARRGDRACPPSSGQAAPGHPLQPF